MALVRVRPSSQHLAEKCKRAPYLSAKFVEKDARTEHGTSVDGEATAALTGGPEPASIEGRKIMEWLRKTFPAEAEYFVQRKVRLLDPVTGELLTEGTPDLVVLIRSLNKIFVVDWKTIGQWFAGHLPAPDENPQQFSYMVAAGMELGATEGQIILALFDDRGVDPKPSKVYPAEAWWPHIERVRAIEPIDLDGPEPEATKGEHCGSCYQKHHCSAYLLPAIKDVPVALEPFIGEGRALTQEEAVAALAWVVRAEEAVKVAGKVIGQVVKQLETYATLNGPIRDGDREWGPSAKTGNRRGPSVKELEELGLTQLIKPGKAGIEFDWKKIKAA